MSLLSDLYLKLKLLLAKLLGFSRVESGDTVDLSGVDGRYSGEPVVNPTRHNTEGAEYNSDVKTERSGDIE